METAQGIIFMFDNSLHDAIQCCYRPNKSWLKAGLDMTFTLIDLDN